MLKALHVQCHAQRHAQGTHMDHHHEPSLAIVHAPAMEVALPDDWLKGRLLPRLQQPAWLHIVVRVDLQCAAGGSV
jgi:hypothetical protein